MAGPPEPGSPARPLLVRAFAGLQFVAALARKIRVRPPRSSPLRARRAPDSAVGTARSGVPHVHVHAMPSSSRAGQSSQSHVMDA
jgi:hypothetical protein